MEFFKLNPLFEKEMISSYFICVLILIYNFLLLYLVYSWCRNIFESSVTGVTKHLVAWLKSTSVPIVAEFLQFIKAVLREAFVSVDCSAGAAKQIGEYR